MPECPSSSWNRGPAGPSSPGSSGQSVPLSVPGTRPERICGYQAATQRSGEPSRTRLRVPGSDAVFRGPERHVEASWAVTQRLGTPTRRLLPRVLVTSREQDSTRHIDLASKRPQRFGPVFTSRAPRAEDRFRCGRHVGLTSSGCRCSAQPG